MARPAVPAAALLALCLAAAAGAQDAGAPPAAPDSPSAAPGSGSHREPDKSPGAPAAVAWLKDLEAAKAAARGGGRRIVAVVTEEFYPSDLCDRMEKALEEPEARAALEGVVPLRIVEKEDAVFSKALGLQDLGHPYTALLDAEGRVLAHTRGALAAAPWAREVRRLEAAAAVLEKRRAEAEKAPRDPKALFAHSESLRDLGRDREADDLLAKAENADPDDRAGLLPLFRFRRVEARVEDRMAAQDFDGARALLDAYDREFPVSPRRRWIAFYRAVARAYRGEPEPALEDLRELAVSAAKDETLVGLVNERIASLEKVLEKRK